MRALLEGRSSGSPAPRLFTLKTLRCLLLALSFGAASCGDGPTSPNSDPTIACPANQTAQAHAGQEAVPVQFPMPTLSNTRVPFAITCSPASGSTFPVGSTTVACTASDGVGHQVSCSFAVRVDRIPQLGKTTFLAFGDSLTEGTTSASPLLLALNPPQSYPFKLQALLVARYVDQAVTVANEGRAGEPVIGLGEARFATVIDAARPEVVLLLDGANDLLAGRLAAIPGIIDALERMVDRARGNGVLVMLATLPPQDPAGIRGGAAGAVGPLNVEIAGLAARKGLRLVDIHGALNGNPAGVIGVDGLHPTEAGYTRIAQIWFDAITAAFEQTPH